MAANSSGKEHNEARLKWWQLSMLGVAFTIGTGYFLGSSLAIQIAGPAVIVSFILAALGTYTVYDVLAKMTAEEPLKGSFRSYAKKAFGRWAGFSSGWVYWSSELLIMGSQMTALSFFTRFWFPSFPMWIFAAGYAILALLILLMGTKGFERLENLFALIKIAAIIMFLIIAALALAGWISGGKHSPKIPLTIDSLIPTGFMGFWSSLLYAFYSFGGIEILGMMAMRLRNPKEAPKSGRVMIASLTIVYVISISLALIIIPLEVFHPKESPFILALNNYRLPFVSHIFNAVLIIAAFSTMVASLFAVTTMLVTLAEDHDAPSIFSVKWRNKLPLPALGMTTAGLTLSIILSLFMPGNIYEYMATAAGLLLLYNWLFILITSGSLLDFTWFGQTKRYVGMILILAAVSGSLLHTTSRPGFWVSLIFIGIIGIVTVVMSFLWKKHKKKKPASAT